MLTTLSLLSLAVAVPAATADHTQSENRSATVAREQSSLMVWKAGQAIGNADRFSTDDRETRIDLLQQRAQVGFLGCAAADPALNRFEDIVALSSSPDYQPTRIVYIDATAPLGGDGSSWAEAFQSFQDALVDAETNYNSEIIEFRVAGGIYRADRVKGVDTLDPDLTIQLPGLTWNGAQFVGVKSVKGGYAGRNSKNPDARDIALYPTVVTGDLFGDDTETYDNYADNTRIMFLPNQTELNGLILEHARIAVYAARWMTDCTVRWCFSDSNAGGSPPGPADTLSPLYAVDARVVGCSFDRNKGNRYGGAVNCTGFTVVANSRFTRNCAPTGGAIGSTFYLSNSDYLIVQNGFFSENISDSSQGGIGGAVSFFTLPPEHAQFVHCTFVGNVTVGGGGQAAINTQNSMSCHNSIFDQNFAYNGTGIEAECTIFIGSEPNRSKFSANLFRQFNENLVNNPMHPGFRLNHEGTPGFANLFGTDGEFGTADDDPSLGEGSASIGRSVFPPDFADAEGWQLGLFDLADLDGDCDLIEPLPVDIFGNPRAIESVAGEGIAGYPADAGCAEFAPAGDDPVAMDWTVPDRSITDYSEDPIRLYVDRDAPSGGDGSSWLSAMSDLADALATAAGRVGPVEVWVAEGAYPAPVSASNIGAFQLTENTTLLGGFTGTETSADERDPAQNTTILTGDVLGNDDLTDESSFLDNTRQVVIGIGRRGGGTVDGFTIQSGYPQGIYVFGAGLFNTSSTRLQGTNAGALLYSASGQLTVRNCEIGPIPLDVTQAPDRPMTMMGLFGQSANLTIEDSRIVSTRFFIPTSTFSSIVLDRSRLAVMPEDGWGDLTIQDSVMNLSNDIKFCVADFGGNISVNRSSLSLETTASINPVVEDGRGFEISDTTIVLNRNLMMQILRTDTSLINTTVNAPGVSLLLQNPLPLRSMAVSNNAFAVSGIVALPLPPDSSGYTVASNTFPSSMTPTQLAAYGPTNTTFDFANNAGSFFVDPLGADGQPYTGDEDLRLAPGSPGINTGLNTFVDSDTDLDGNDRIIGSVVDRGAYEFTGTCTGDVNGDGHVDLGDLNLVLANFGQALPFGDASGDGAVNLTDLNIVLAAFGNTCD